MRRIVMASNPTLEKMRLKIRYQQIELNRNTVSLRIAELHDEITRLSENIPSYEKELEGITNQIAGLEKVELDKMELEKTESNFSLNNTVT